MSRTSTRNAIFVGFVTLRAPGAMRRLTASGGSGSILGQGGRYASYASSGKKLGEEGKVGGKLRE